MITKIALTLIVLSAISLIVASLYFRGIGPARAYSILYGNEQNILISILGILYITTIIMSGIAVMCFIW